MGCNPDVVSYLTASLQWQDRSKVINNLFIIWKRTNIFMDIQPWDELSTNGYKWCILFVWEMR